MTQATPNYEPFYGPNARRVRPPSLYQIWSR